MSAIFYQPERLLDSPYGFLIRFNPLYAVIANFRNAVLGRPPELFYTLYPVAVSLVILVAGLAFFYKKQDRFVLYI